MPRRVSWLTDVHLNFLRPPEVSAFLQRVAADNPDALLLGGDVAEAPTLVADLERIDEQLARPIYFVLGNHDFYRGSIASVRRQVAALCARRPTLIYLTQQTEPIELAPGVGLVGHDGWADARVGDYENSEIMLNDYLLIEELAHTSKSRRRELLEAMGDETAAHFRRLLPLALDRFPRVVLLTHVPPMREACWHMGRISDDAWAPHFTCKAAGDSILEIMAGRPDRELTVLCGHTHSPGEVRPQSNVVIHTGHAEYGQPKVQRVLTL
ncbi:MAG: metallophosphoesterase [Pirellulales bacterium]